MNLLQSYIFQHAYAGRYPDLSRALRKIGQLSASVDPKGNTPLMAAAIGGCPDCVKALLPLSSPRQLTRQGDALMAACLHGQFHAAQALLPYSDPRAQAIYTNQTALHIASERGCSNLVAMLLPRSDGQLADASGMTPLALACRAGRVDIVDILGQSFDFDMTPTSPSRHPVSIACGQASSECLSALLAIRPDLANLPLDARRRTPLMTAVEHKSIACISLLLPLSNTAATDEHGSTALMLAAEHGFSTCVELLAHASPIFARNQAGKTAEQIARYRGHSQATAILVAFSTARELSQEIQTPSIHIKESSPARL